MLGLSQPNTVGLLRQERWRQPSRAFPTRIGAPRDLRCGTRFGVIGATRAHGAWLDEIQLRRLTGHSRTDPLRPRYCCGKERLGSLHVELWNETID